MKETDCAQVDEDQYEVRPLKDENQHYKRWNMCDVEGMVCHSIFDTAATIGIIGEEPWLEWNRAREVYGIEDGIKTEKKQTKLRFANSKTNISKKKVYLKTEMFGNVGWTEAAVVQGNLGLLFSRKCVE